MSNPNKVDVDGFFKKFKDGKLVIAPQPTVIVQMCLHCKQNSGELGINPAEFCKAHARSECRLGTVKKGPGGTWEHISIGDFEDA